MNVSLDEIKYAALKLHEIRFARRGKIFLKPKKKRIDPESMFSVISFYEYRHTQAACVQLNDLTIIITLGSNQIMDWFYNLFFIKGKLPYNTKNKKIKVHRGFLATYMNMRGWMINQTKDCERVLFLGHSLGGTLATLGSLDYAHNNPDKLVTCVTTGSPKLGNQEFVDSFDRKVEDSIRFVYKNDIVPSVPLDISGFRHVKGKHQFGKRSKWLRKASNHLLQNGYLESIVNLKGE